MPNNIIRYDTSTPMGREVQAAAQELQSAYQRLTKLAAVLVQADAMTSAGVAVTPAVSEVGQGAGDLFGVASGQGQAFAAAVYGLSTALTLANRAQLSTLLR